MHNINTILCQTANQIQLKLLMFGHAVIDPEWKGYIYNPVYSRLYYICSGEAFVKAMDGEVYCLKPGRWYLLPAGFSFEYGCEKQMEHVYFDLKVCGFDGIDLVGNSERPVLFVPEKDKSKLFDSCAERAGISDALKMQQEVYSVLISMIEENDIKISSREFSPCVLKAIKYIKRHLSSKLSISEIAENAYVSKSTLAKHFSKELSMSVHEYISDALMFEAGQLLTQGTLSILEISEKFGFSDQFYFSKCFKQKFGMSPREYRKTKLI